MTVSDFICIPYTADLTQAGIQYACRSLPHIYQRAGGSPFDRLRRSVAGVSVELALRRYLTQQNVPFSIRGATPFTDPDRYDVSLGGHRLDIKSFLISYREQISSIHANPGEMLKAPGLVPVDQYAGDGRDPRDLYVFAFLTGLVASSTADVQKASAAGLPLYVMHAMPSSWVRPLTWTPLSPLVLKSESDKPLTVEIGGQDAGRGLVTRTIELAPHKRTEVDGDFYSLAYLHAAVIPEKRVGIRAAVSRETYVVAPHEWGNVWIYGMRIYLTGWITREEFRQRASLLPEGSRVFQYDRTRTKNLAVPIGDLRPLPELLARARQWVKVPGSELGNSSVP